MNHTPRHATIHVIDLPDREAVHRVSHVLIERGHSVVRLVTETRWRVIGLDEGPYPSDDESWWRATEDRFVTRLAQENGGRHMISQADPATARRLFADGEAVADRTSEQVRGPRIATLSREPARAAAPIIVHRLNVRERSAGPTGEAVTLSGLNAIDWASFSHAYGNAGDVPELLLRLAANDEGWEEASFDYFSAVVHQGTCYNVTPSTIGFLVQLAQAPHLLPEYRLDVLMNLAYLATLDATPASGERIDDHASHEASTCRAVIGHLPALLDLWPDASMTTRAWLVILATLDPITDIALLPNFRDYRQSVEGPSPALDLALALLAHNEDTVLDLTLQAATWDEQVQTLLEGTGPLRARHLEVLLHLAMTEFSPKDA